MYGKIFSQMYEGSMVGAGATVFAVMGYAISRQQPPDFNVELNTKLLAAILGESEAAVQDAIIYLCSPDTNSRTEEHEGRRMVQVGSFTYHMVNGRMYHDIRNYEERKAYNRDAQKKFREKQKAKGIVVPLTETQKDLINPPENTKPKKPTPIETDEFVTFWTAYPRKVAKVEAIKAFFEQDASENIPKILAALAWQKKLPDWVKDGGQYIPYPATWLRDKRWNDDDPNAAPTPAYVNPQIPPKVIVPDLFLNIWNINRAPIRSEFRDDSSFKTHTIAYLEWKKSYLKQNPAKAKELENAETDAALKGEA